MTTSTFNVSRRRFGKALGLGAGATALGVTIRFDLGVEEAQAQTTQAANAANLPIMIRSNPNLNAWVRVAPNGSITIFTGRVELGQGCLTAMRQIAAEELDVPPLSMQLISGDTAQSPDEGVTAGSFAIKQGGAALGHACADARAALLAVAAQAWGQDAASLSVQNGVIQGRNGEKMPYGDAAAKVSLNRNVDASAKRKPASQQKVIGTSFPRVDIPAKVFAQEVFIHDMRPQGMLFAAVARPPAYAARLLEVDLALVQAMPGVVKVVRDGSFLGVVAKREEQARAAAEKLTAQARWDKGPELFNGRSVFEHLRTAPHEVKVIHQTKVEGSNETSQAFKYQAEYQRAFQAHASIGASCALAHWQDGKVTVWSHTQGPYPLRSHLAKGLRMSEKDIRVVHVQGSGCYGHNGADDVAFDAALLARAVPGSPVRVHWLHEEEMAWEPWGSAMIVKMEGSASKEGVLDTWNHEVWSFPHSTRPAPSGGMDGCNLRSAWYLADPVGPTKAIDGPLPNGASGRNAVTIYNAPNHKVTTHYHDKGPIRTSALRTLGGFFNAVSADMFLDEMAARLGIDPVSMRLKNLKDPRQISVLQQVVRESGWTPQPVKLGPALAPEMLGFGVGLSRYKNQDSYVACVAQVSVNTQTGAIKVPRMWSCTDTGRIISPDGVINQIEGGMVQAVSWMLLEAGRFEGGIMKAVDYASYPILNYLETPVIQSSLIDRPDQLSLGAGEGSQAPAGAAVANAVFAATGRRIYDVPFAREKVLSTLKA